MTLMLACPELPKLSLLRDDLSGAGVVCQFAVRNGSALSDLVVGYVVRMQDGVQKFFLLTLQASRGSAILMRISSGWFRIIFSGMSLRLESILRSSWDYWCRKL